MSPSTPAGGTQPSDPIQVVEFVLNDQPYCVTIDNVSELVDREEITPLPDAPEHVAGLMDLRGETTTIIDPRIPLEISEEGPQQRIIVFDADTDDTVGWLVDEVREVMTVSPETIEYDTDSQFVTGAIKRDEEFILWLDPTTVNTADQES